ncbi:MAG: PAS domain S-box protein [Bacteroidota bacterium]|nr:PAS domain S-box protein [Candidatus Kapabacteria bacterium]MDW8220635.1 PAS domain S-box protein [Bacteroidota bacterium]
MSIDHTISPSASNQNHTQQELQRYKTMLEEAERLANIGSWEFDVTSQKITWSQQTFRIFGMEPQAEAPSFEEYLSMIAEEDRSKMLAVIQDAIQYGTSYVVEGRIVGRDGVPRYQEGRGRAIMNEEGKVVRLIGTVRDVTERYVRMRELQQSEMRLRSIIENTNTILVTALFDGTLTFASETVEKALGYTPHEVTGKPFADYVHPDHVPFLIELLHQARAGQVSGTTIDIRIHHRDGTWRWFSIITSLVHDELGKPSHVLCIGQDITQQKVTQEKLRRSQESLAEAQRMAHLGSWYVDLQTGNIEWSSELYRILGVPETTAPLKARDFISLVLEQDQDKVINAFVRAIKHRETIREEIRINRHGSVRWLDARLKPILAPDAQTVIALFGTIWDITERKITDQQIRALNLRLEERVRERTQQLEEANRQLRTSQSNLKALIENINDAIWSIDRNYRLTAMNAALYSLLTVYNEYCEPRLGDNVLHLIPGTEANVWKTLYDRALNGERFTTYMHYTLKGAPLHVEVSFNPITDEYSTVVGVVIYSRNITEQLQREQELREREQLLQLIFDTVPVGICLLDHNGVLRRINTEFAHMIGHTSASELVDKVFYELLPDDTRDSFIQQYQAFFIGGVEHDALDEIRLVCNDGSVCHAHFAASLFTTATGERLCITTITDITLRKAAEDEIKRALEQERELNNLKSRFVSMVSHEFRTPLTTIRASAQLLERLHHRISPEKQQEYLRDIQQAVDTMAHLMEDILYLAKADAQKLRCTPTAVDFARLCESIINGLEIAPENEHRITARLDNALPSRLLLDEKLMRQILTNLLSNALKYSPREQAVYLDAIFTVSSPEHNSLAHTISTSDTEQHGILRLSIKDNGIGIAHEDLRHLFEPFYRASNAGQIPGTGLGLAIVKQAVEAHGGFVTCMSTLGQGTEFIVVIPCQAILPLGDKQHL